MLRQANRKGYLIVFEGLDGSGKSTQARRLHQVVNAIGFVAHFRFEPTDGIYGSQIRDGLLAGKRHSPEEELELFRLDRKEHVRSVIQPALDRGEVVILDRYYYSSMAYQGIRGYKSPEEIHRLMTDFAPVPDLTFIIEIEVTEALRRISSLRGDQPNPMEQVENLRRVKETFDQMRFPEIQRIDGSKMADAVFEDICSHTQRLLGSPLDQSVTFTSGSPG